MKVSKCRFCRFNWDLTSCRVGLHRHLNLSHTFYNPLRKVVKPGVFGHSKLCGYRVWVISRVEGRLHSFIWIWWSCKKLSKGIHRLCWTECSWIVTWIIWKEKKQNSWTVTFLIFPFSSLSSFLFFFFIKGVGLKQ